MSKQAQQETISPVNTPERPLSWVQTVSEAKKSRQDGAESKIKTALSCRNVRKKPALYAPSDMAELQPRTLNYLQAFTKNNNLKLVEDRRKSNSKQANEKRAAPKQKLVLGMSMLLKQGGMPGAARKLSEPHRLDPEGTFVSIADLIDMAAYSAPKSKRAQLEPNTMTSKALNNDTQLITAHACNLITDNTSTLLSHYESSKFRAIGYSTGKQYIFHLCLGGGTVENPELWVDLEVLKSTDFKFHLFEGSDKSDDYGLFYTTMYLDLSQAPLPWWLQQVTTETDQVATNDAVNADDKVA